MYRRINIINYRCFNSLDVSFVDNRQSLKQTIIILGENNTGKTALISAFILLRKSIESFLFETNETSVNIFYEASIRQEIQDCVLDQNKPVSLSVELQIGGAHLRYTLVYSACGFLLTESLEKFSHGEFKSIYHLSEQTIHFGKRYFTQQQRNLIDALHAAHGQRYTLLSYLRYLIWMNHPDFTPELLNATLLDLILFLSRAYLYSDENNYSHYDMFNRIREVNVHPLHGQCSDEGKHLLKSVEPLISAVIHWLFPAYEYVQYHFNLDNSYQLYFYPVHKTRNPRAIPYTQLSKSTQTFIQHFPGFLNAYREQSFIADDFDRGLNHFLLQELFSGFLPKFNGQLILSVTSSDICEWVEPASLYICQMDDEMNYKISCIQDRFKTQKNNNNRNRYEKGRFGKMNYTIDVTMLSKLRVLDQYLNKIGTMFW